MAREIGGTYDAHGGMCVCVRERERLINRYENGWNLTL